jgi:hypothetical protein
MLTLNPFGGSVTKSEQDARFGPAICSEQPRFAY